MPFSSAGDDSNVIVFDMIHRQFPLVFDHPLADTVGDEGFLQQGVPHILFICEDVVDHLVGPSLDTLRCRNVVGLQFLFDIAQAGSLQVAPVDPLDRLRFLRDDLRLAVLTLAITQHFLVLEGDIALPHTELLSFDNILALGFTLRLGEAAEQSDEELTGLSEGVDVFLFEW